MNPIQEAVLSFRMLCIAHRLRKFGFESQINDLTTDELAILANMLYPHQRAAVEREIAERTALVAEKVSHG